MVCGKIPVFKISEVSMVDIETLIDIGMRFDLRETLPEGERFDDIARYIKDGNDRIRVRSYRKGITANTI